MASDNCWVDKCHYWEHTASQGSQAWLNSRNRLTASKFDEATSDNPKFDSQEDIAAYILGTKKPVFTPEATKRMQFGTNNEPRVRDWYIKTYNLKVIETGLAVPKWNLYLGASSDGDVYDENNNCIGVIEIKCPRKMYGPLLKNSQNANIAIADNSNTKSIYEHDHIWSSHYAQMQGNMAIKGVSWCDYIVADLYADIVIVERVYFNQEYWSGYLYPRLVQFIDKYLLNVDKNNWPPGAELLGSKPIQCDQS